MNEIDFVHAIQKRLQKDAPGAVVLKVNDRNTQGIPDLLIFHHTTVVAIECKSVGHEPRDRTLPWLEHPFSMPQVTLLRDLRYQGIIALGLIEYRPEDKVYALHPKDLHPSLSLADVVAKGLLVDMKSPILFLEQLRFAMDRLTRRTS